MEDLEVELIEELGKNFRTNELKPIGFFSKLFNICYSSVDIYNILKKAVELKLKAQNRIEELTGNLDFSKDIIKEWEIKHTDLVSENKSLLEKIEELENSLKTSQHKYTIETGKLAKTIDSLSYSKCNLETEVKSLRKDLDTCNEKFKEKSKTSNKEVGSFMDKLLKTNEKLTNEVNSLKLQLKNKKIKVSA